MPQYELEDRYGNRTMVEMTMKEFRGLQRSEDGEQVAYEGGWYTPLLFGSGGQSPCWGGWGFRSDAMGVNPDQIKEQMAADRRNGVTGVKYDRKTGEAVYESRDARAKHLAAYGFRNKQAYSGRV